MCLYPVAFIPMPLPSRAAQKARTPAVPISVSVQTSRIGAVGSSSLLRAFEIDGCGWIPRALQCVASRMVLSVTQCVVMSLDLSCKRHRREVLTCTPSCSFASGCHCSPHHLQQQAMHRSVAAIPRLHGCSSRGRPASRSAHTIFSALFSWRLLGLAHRGRPLPATRGTLTAFVYVG